MSSTPLGRPTQPDRYEIRIDGRLGPRWATAFDGMSLRTTGDGVTVLEGVVADQPALHGLLRTVNDLGLTLLSVTQLPAPTPQGD